MSKKIKQNKEIEVYKSCIMQQAMHYLCINKCLVHVNEMYIKGTETHCFVLFCFFLKEIYSPIAVDFSTHIGIRYLVSPHTLVYISMLFLHQITLCISLCAYLALSTCYLLETQLSKQCQYVSLL